MMKFEDIKTAQELIDYISIHGMPTDEESICRMQDIVGHTAIEDLDFLANNIGRTDEYGNPDIKGSRNGGRNTQRYFYPLIFSIWNWEDAVRFWNQHTNPDKEMLTKSYEECKNYKKHNEALLHERDDAQDTAKEAQARVKELENKLAEQERITAARDAEIIRLKAKLYDLVEAEQA